MTDLREKVAQALCAVEDARWDAQDFNETPNGETPEEMRERYRDLASSVLAIPEIAEALEAKRVRALFSGGEAKGITPPQA